jgi:hypothetical protein
MEEWKCDPQQIKELLAKYKVVTEFSVYRNEGGDMFLMWKHREVAAWVVLGKADWLPRQPLRDPTITNTIRDLWFRCSYLPEELCAGLLPYITLGV